MSTPWLTIRKPVPPLRSLLLKTAAFLLPLALWCLVSYCPYVWHPQMRITNSGDSAFLHPDDRADKAAFFEENARLVAEHKTPASAIPANPVYLPEPHAVARAFYTAFTTEPQRRGDPWLHQSLLQSAFTIFAGFSLAALLAIPLGILCGTFDAIAKLTEPFVDFFRYMPPPVFGALAVAILGIDTGPKIAIIFIGVFFNMVLVVANTTRTLDPALLEAAQTLGAKRPALITHVILPGILPGLYKDLRILIGAAWTFLTVAELIGAMSGLSQFINQQGKYRHFENVFAGIFMIGIAGFLTDQFLAFLGTIMFPYLPNTNHKARRWFAWLSFLFQPIQGSRPEPLRPEELAALQPNRAVPTIPADDHPILSNMEPVHDHL